MADTPNAGSARLFVALWPTATVRTRLAAFRDEWRWPAGARPVADADLHLTLHFIGSVAHAEIAPLCTRLADVPARRISLQSAATAVWAGGIAVLALQADAVLAALHRELVGALRPWRTAADPRPFAPHVTLARRAHGAEPPATLPDLDWQATSYVLVESSRRPQGYEALAAWDASAPAAPAAPAAVTRSGADYRQASASATARSASR